MENPALTRLNTLSSRYARFSTRGGGLDWIAGGGILAVAGALVSGWALGTLLGQGRALDWTGFLATFPQRSPGPASPGLLVLCLAAPALWVGLRALIHARVHHRFGRAQERKTEREAAEIARRHRGSLVLIPAWALIFGEPVFAGRISAGRAFVAFVLIAGVALATWRARGKVDLTLTGLVFMLPGVLWGFGATRSVIAFAAGLVLGGLGILAAGAVQHLRFRALVREMEGRP
jgi:hypothetical protein